jgi:hypothetical protein
MGKAEEGRAALLEMLGETGARPADDVIGALTYREIGVKPAIDLATVIARPDEFRDRLLAELALTPADVEMRELAAPDGRHAYWLYTFALYLLALWEDPRAYQPIVAHLAADPAAADGQLEDIVTEDLPAMLARTYDGSDLGDLKALIESPDAPPFLRDACLRGLHAMSRLGKLGRDEVVAYFETLAQSLDLAANEDFVDVFAMSMAALQEQRLRPVIDRWFAEGVIDTALSRPVDIDATYRAPYDEISEELTGRERFDGLIDYLSEWPWFVVSDPDELRDARDDLDGATVEELLEYEASQPLVREGRKIGRNEPCPCGSGKKYKKCCLGAEGI